MISGIIGVIIRDIYSTFAKLIGLSKIFIWDVGADLFVTGKEVHGVFAEILGFSTDFVVGGMLGVIIGLLLEWRGQKYYLLKGCIVGLLLGFSFSGLPFTISRKLPKQRRRMRPLTGVDITSKENASDPDGLINKFH